MMNTSCQNDRAGQAVIWVVSGKSLLLYKTMSTLECGEHHRFGYVWETVGFSMALLLTFPQYENFFVIVHVGGIGCGSGISVVSRALMLTALQITSIPSCQSRRSRD